MYMHIYITLVCFYVSGNRSFFSGALRRCGVYIDQEMICSMALANSDTGLRTSVLSLENALVDAISGGLTTAVCYVSAFLVDKRSLFPRHV